MRSVKKVSAVVALALAAALALSACSGGQQQASSPEGQGGKAKDEAPAMAPEKGTSETAARM
jgi:ABC-type glycerol-3-phosphate transport system substrate-binding protein